MRTFAMLCTIGLFVAAFAAMPASAHKHSCTTHKHSCTLRGDNDNLFRDDNVEVNFEDGSVIFTHEDDETVEICSEGGLLVKGEPVHLARDQKKLTKKYYETFEDIVERGKKIGLEGAKIGAQGAKLGIAAALGVLKLLADDYDSDDLEMELEQKGEKMEHVAERFKHKTERLERTAEKLQDLHEKLRGEIDELDELGWF